MKPKTEPEMLRGEFGLVSPPKTHKVEIELPESLYDSLVDEAQDRDVDVERLVEGVLVEHLVREQVIVVVNLGHEIAADFRLLSEESGEPIEFLLANGARAHYAKAIQAAKLAQGDAPETP